MLVTEKTFQEEDGSVGYYDAVYDSSNILQTTYFPTSERLYISFNRGGVYSYEGVDPDLYDEFKNAESQGKFFAEKIKSQTGKYPYRKEFTLYPDEVKELKEMVERGKEEDDEEIMIHVGETEFDTYQVDENGNRVWEEGEIPSPLLTFSNELEANNIIFYLEDEEVIKVSPEGFFWKGNLVEEDKEIYKKFKEWVDYAHSRIPSQN